MTPAQLALTLMDAGLSAGAAGAIVDQARDTIRPAIETLELAVVRVLREQARAHAAYIDQLEHAADLIARPAATVTQLRTAA